MRFYYVCIAAKPVPKDLLGRIDELHGGSWLGPKARATLSWVLDHMETAVMFGFIAVVLYAFSLT